MKPRAGLRVRLTLTYGALFLVATAVLVAIMYVQTSRAINSQFNVQFTQNSDSQGGQAAGIRIGSGPPLITSGPTTAGDTFQGSLMVSKDQVTKALDAKKAEVLNQLIQNSLIAVAVLAIVGLGIGYFIAGRSLRPLKKVTRTARRLSESNLHQRIGLDGPHDEIRELADTFDAMLDRLDRAFAAQRRFVANSSHELRTPLTINRAVLEVALASRRSSEETKTLAETLLGTTERHERLIEGLLLLAKSERELTTRADVSLPDVVRGALDQLQPSGVEIVTDLEPATTTGDPVLLERCAANLIENAAKYNVPDGHVHIRTGLVAGSPVLQVENTGPRIAPYEIETIFEPFRRLRPDRADRVGSAKGAGLGMSIVEAIVRAHGGSVEAVPRDDGGLLVTILLESANHLAPRLAVTAPA